MKFFGKIMAFLLIFYILVCNAIRISLLYAVEKPDIKIHVRFKLIPYVFFPSLTENFLKLTKKVNTVRLSDVYLLLFSLV